MREIKNSEDLKMTIEVNNKYKIVPLEKAVVNKYINIAKKHYDEDNLKKEKFVKNFKWKIAATLLLIIPMAFLCASTVILLMWSTDLASIIALSILSITIASAGTYIVSAEVKSLLYRKKRIMTEDNSFSSYFEKAAWVSDDVNIEEFAEIYRIIQFSLMTDSRVKNRNFEHMEFEQLAGNKAVFRLYYNNVNNKHRNNMLFMFESEVDNNIDEVEININDNSVKLPFRDEYFLKGVNITKQEMLQTA